MDSGLRQAHEHNERMQKISDLISDLRAVQTHLNEGGSERFLPRPLSVDSVLDGLTLDAKNLRQLVGV